MTAIGKPIKAVLLIRSLNLGGTERQLVLLASELKRAKQDVRVLVFYRGGALEGELTRVGVPVDSLEKTGPWDVFRSLSRLIKLVRRNSPDVLLTFLTDANVLGAFAKPFIGSTKLVWGVRASEVPTLTRSQIAERISFAVSRWLSSAADLIVFNSRAGLDYHVKVGYQATRAVVIPNGFDTIRFCRKPERAAEIRKEWGIAPETILVGLVARTDPIKGHEVFLRAAGQLAKRWPETTVVLVGGGTAERQAKLRKFADTQGLSGRILWAGPNQDMAAVYSALNVVALASLAEGFPNVLGEAMACQSLCVAFNVGDAHLLMGDTGLIVPNNDASSLALGLERALRLTPLAREQHQNAARTRILDNYGIERLTERTLGALRALISKE